MSVPKLQLNIPSSETITAKQRAYFKKRLGTITEENDVVNTSIVSSTPPIAPKDDPKPVKGEQENSIGSSVGTYAYNVGRAIAYFCVGAAALLYFRWMGPVEEYPIGPLPGVITNNDVSPVKPVVAIESLKEPEKVSVPLQSRSYTNQGKNRQVFGEKILS